MSILDQIFEERRADVERARGEVSLEELKELATARVHHSLVDKLGQPSGTKVIAEVKKASPSAGCLREDYRPAELAGLYAESGAVGISVLTEPNHFMGSADDLRAVRAVVDLPILRKDFMCDAYQVYESAAWGADVILLIAAGLDVGLMRDLYDVAINCGLDVLAEAHSEDELRAVIGLEKAIIGVNSRDLRTLKTDLAVAERLAPLIPEGRLAIAESGIKTQSDIAKLQTVQYSGFLVGESLLKDRNPGEVLRALTG
jgi:indole-3-glycerol phosphate synthase